ncbi:hypothetical protein ALC53_13696 [Atta colombica]|uniref:Tc1-like transposase DDE domain-containing protein n=1 Tax=Atta colombica TaxID=520822 RepID=A0A195ATS6_9HYME|nr:hypothetical protein ALC53_13696 [Atta colombica]
MTSHGSGPLMHTTPHINSKEYINKYYSMILIKTLDWPAKSPDLNVIENFWCIIVQEWELSSSVNTRGTCAIYNF